MKKSLVAVSVIVVLGAAWTGASWYTGKLIEQHMGEVVDNANGQLKAYLPKAGVKLSYENYQRGLFNSQVRLVLRADGNDAANGAELKPGDEVAFLETIDHGPFPFAQLKKFNLLPSMASVHTQLENTPAVKELFEITKGKSLFTADSRISYSGDTASAIDIIPLDYQKDKSSLKFSGATLNADVSSDLKTIALDANSDNIAVSSPNAFGQNEQITFQGFNLKGTSNESKFGVKLGDQTMTLKQFKLAVDGKDAVALDGFNLVSKFGEQGSSNIGGQIDYTMDALKVQGNDFGAGKLTLKIDNVDGKALKDFADSYNQQAMALLQQGENLDPDVYEQQTTELLQKYLPLLLKGNPSISVAPLSWKNSKGESTFTLDLALTDPSKAGAQAESPDQMVARVVKKLDLSLTIPEAMATEVTAQTALLQGYNAEDAQKLAQQQVQGLAAMGQMFKLTTQKDGVIASKFHYADNQVDLNGNKMSLQEFIGQFGLLGAPAEDGEPAQDAEPAPAPAQ
ncbi:GTP-binding protein [Serratia marcescens]|uniref:GTP-binding protein n=1 Tax=Serratia marcescens TaxID=615 RepID=A0A1Q4NUP9_SERMA|nr:YdgA family protein [Serratia marcescens]OKB64630.1 GTP-binding protein [Serratia marcescens]